MFTYIGKYSRMLYWHWKLLNNTTRSKSIQLFFKQHIYIIKTEYNYFNFFRSKEIYLIELKTSFFEVILKLNENIIKSFWDLLKKIK